MRAFLRISGYVLIGFILSFISGSVKAQSFDFQSRPVFDYQLSDAQINLRVDPDAGTLNGSVQYSVKANIAAADTLSLDAAGLQVDSVLSAGKSVPFSVQNDQLQIVLTDSATAGKSYPVKIIYHGTPHFGLLKSSEGTVWTSLLPRTNRHWLPVKDHPRVQMITTLSLQVPADYTAFASGVQTDEQRLPDSTKKVTFRTSRPIPVTALAFGLGHFREKGASVGIKRVSSYAETNSISPSEQTTVVSRAKELLGEIEQATGRDYPYQRVNLVILNDHYWEQKPYGAATIFLYKNRGDWISQLRRGLYAQWIGVFEHEEQWAQSWPIYLMQTALHKKLTDSDALLKAHTNEPKTGFSTIYDNFSAERWNAWQQYNSAMMATVSDQLVTELLQLGPEVITPESFNDAWYKLSGRPSITVPQFHNQPAGNNSSSTDTVRYRVDYLQNGASGNLLLAFKAQQGVVQEPVTLPVKITPGNNDSQVTFSGATDTVSVSVPAGARNVELMIPEGESLALEEHKPVPYLLYQLRNAETTDEKVKAAQQIGYQTDNPDLQLALDDVMKQQMEPNVKAALLRSYGAITNGAEGTEQRFFEALDSDSPAVRQAGLAVLKNYKSKKITARLKTLSQNQSDAELSEQALNVYLQRIDSTQAISFTNTLVQQDTAGTRAITAIAALADRGNSKQAVHLATFYIEPVYAYPVRKQALQILLANDQSTENWKERAKKLLNDIDPRIRFLMVQSMDQIPGIDASSLLSSHQEYDARVFKVMSD